MGWCLGTPYTGSELVEGILEHPLCQARWEEMGLFGLRMSCLMGGAGAEGVEQE